jgi:His/Glu/Gln/Arg/opine family amino acid ABC transporter permease subunit
VIFRHLALLALLTTILSGCAGSTYSWGWYAVLPLTDQGRDNLRFLVSGVGMTLALSTISIMFSVLIGMVVSLASLSNNLFLRSFNRTYVEIFRSVPILVMILWVYYGLPVLLGISLSPFVAGVIAMVACDSAFQAEIFRGGIQSIHRGQAEASDSLGLSYLDKMRFVIMPQAIKRILPPLGNQFIYMLKMSSLVSVIGLMELTRRANELTVVEYRPLEIYTVLLLEYLVLILVASHLVRRLERRMNVGQ